MNCGLYIRVSTPEQAREGYSIGEQTERLKSYCAAMKWDVFGSTQIPGYSGSNMERPGLQALIADAEAGNINKVVVYKLDRLSRSQMDTLYLIERVFIPNNVDFVSLNENLDTGSSFGRAIIGIMSAFAQLEREMTSERMTMGKDARRKEGKWMGSVSPMGYDYSKETGLLTVNESEAAQIREMFELFNSGTKLYDIQTKFMDKKYTIRGREWRRQMVRDPNCKNKIFRVEELSEIILNEVKKLRFSPERLNGTHHESDQKTELTAKIATINAQISRFLDLYGTGRFDFEQLDSKIAPLEKEREKIQNQLNAIAEPESTEDAQAALKMTDGILSLCDLKQSRALLETLINRIDIDGDDVYINWRF